MQLVNTPQGKMLISSPATTMQVKVRAHGYTLLRYKANALLSPIRINIADCRQATNGGSNYYILTYSSRQKLLESIGDNLEVVGITTDTIFFQMTEVIEKTVDVLPIINVAYARQHMPSGNIVVSPSTVTITGPKAILDTIQHIKTQPLVAGILSSSATFTLTLQQIPYTIYSAKTVGLTIPVDRFTETTIDVPISITNEPDDAWLIVLPSKVAVTCNVVVGQYFQLNPSQFKVTCNYNNRDKVANGKIRLTLDETPDYVSRVAFHPEFVDYFIR